MTTPTDPLFGQQWHFPLIGDIETIWDEFTGNGVSVGVYDDGIETSHPDLIGNYDDSLEFEFDYDGDGNNETGANIPADPMTGNDGHGTSVAGIIAATANNGIGGTGVAYDASITSVNIFLDNSIYPNDYAAYVASLAYAGVFDIMSNSWGYTPLFQDFQNINEPGAQLINEVAGLETAGSTGRGGLGTVIVQAAGNDTLNANGDSINASRFTITVGATDDQGFAQDYSNYGVSLLLAAPAAAVTTDRTGDDGYNNGSESVPDDYTESFGGTSAATPVVSGVVALMLEANENLGWRDVHNILAVTAAQTGENLDGSGGTIDEIGDWAAESGRGGSTWNGGTLSFHASYGFGMVDAFAAVRMAESWLEMTGDAATSANEQTVSVDYDEATFGAVAIPDFVDPTPGVAGITFDVMQDIQIETVMVTVDITHSFGSDLEIYLITPDGDEVPVFFRDGNSDTMDDGFVWTFEVRALLGFSSAGLWQVVVRDMAGGDVGTINDAQIDFYGSTADNDDIHIISRDFQELAAHDAVRTVITDNNGGNDWLNFTGVQENVVLDMTGGGQFTVDGVLWGSLQAGPDVFENTFMGDGDDTVTGNDLVNEIWGGRGNDDLSGAGGKDFLFGGDGDDMISGGNLRDVIEGNDGDDDLFGDDGRDIMDGGEGGDLLNGGQGNDTITGGNGEDDVRGGDQNDTIRGGGNADILNGGRGNDGIRGDGGNDVMSGGQGNDRMRGGAGQDQLNGNRGNDELEGGAGADTFVFANNFDVDTITDFTINVDLLEFNDALWSGDPSGPTDGASLIASSYTTTSGNDVIFTFGGNVVTLEDALTTGVLADIADEITIV